MSAVPAEASFPGQNGKFAEGGQGIDTVNPDGSSRVHLTTGSDSSPAWSPDGGKIVFSRFVPSQTDLWIVNADGSNLHNVTNTGTSGESSPAWSPDGTKIVFQNYNLLEIINADGSGRTTLLTGNTNNFFPRDPKWSPDGSRIAFRAGPPNSEYDIYTVKPDGTSIVNVTNTPTEKEASFDWSPDGSKIAFGSFTSDFSSSDIYTMNADGSSRTNLTNTPAQVELTPLWAPDGSLIIFYSNPGTYDSIMPDGTGRDHFSDETPNDWQPAATQAPAGYPRPKGATPIRVPLVPGFRKCNAPDRQHGGSLSFPSCSIPTPLSTYLTVGTPDANGRGAKETGWVRFNAIPGNPATPADEADIQLETHVEDVRDKLRLSDYIAELRVAVSVRLTDRSPFQTVSDFEFGWSVPCTATADATIGSTCSSVTSADAVLPGAVREGARPIWQLGQVQVSDGGEDGVGSTTADNTPFLKQGIFVP
jgi:TolB protein